MKLLLVLLFSTVFVAYAGSGIFCSLCTELITSLEDELQKDESDIINRADEVCDKLTDGNNLLDPICKQLAAMAIEKVIDDMKKKEDPKKVCAKLQLCN